MNKNTFFLILALFLAACWQPSSKEEQLERVSESDFGTMPDGQIIKRFTLKNANGMVVKVMTYGATITHIEMADNNGKTDNLVAGSDTLENYLQGFPAASVIGRFANRIGNARFTLDEQEYQLTFDRRGKHHIHGGEKGFAKQVWKQEALLTEDNAAGVKLSYSSRDGEEGYPGNLTASITYILNDDNELILAYEAQTDKPTIVNLTNHAYFDLSGKADISNHLLQLHADHYTPTDQDQIPTGEIAPVAGTPLDFREPHLIGSRVNEILAPRAHIYDHNYVINKNGGELQKTAEVYYSATGRAMEVWTDLPGVQLYTGNTRGFCLETQYFPDAVNHPQFPSPVVRPEKPHRSKTVFSFSLR